MLLGTPPSCQVCLPALAIIVTWRAWPKVGNQYFAFLPASFTNARRTMFGKICFNALCVPCAYGLASSAIFTSTCYVSVVYMYFVALQLCCCRVHVSMCSPPHYENPVHLLFPNLALKSWSLYFGHDILGNNKVWKKKKRKRL